MQTDAAPPSLPPARVTIVGAGAIGGLLGVPLSQRGHTVTFHARGAHLAAMQAAGRMTLLTPSGDELHSAPSSSFVSSLDDLPPQDYIILGLKTHQLPSVLPSLQRMLAASPSAALVATQNGVPWWFFQRNGAVGGALRDRVVRAVDPAGALHGGLDPARVLATVVYPAAAIAQPGVVQHESGVRFPVGEPGGALDSPRVVRLAEMLVDAGFKAPVLPDVRAELWLKLWGSVAFNPLSALTHATLAQLCAIPASRAVVESVMREVEQVAAAVGVTMRVPLERRVEGAAKVGEHKTSTLMDCEAGRPMEIDAIMGAVVEIARITETPTPHLDAVHCTVTALAEVLKVSKAKLPLTPL